jgi:hypothetical protein
MNSRFGRNRPLPKRPPKVPRRVEIEHALQSIRQQEKLRFTHEWLVGGKHVQTFFIFCGAWVVVAGGIVALFLALQLAEDGPF